jgi:hypothetical protein
VKLKFYEAGMDMGWSQNLVTASGFSGKSARRYDRLVDEFGLSVIDARWPSRSAADGAQTWCRGS